MKSASEATKANRDRFQILVSAFELTLGDISKVVGLSRPLLSRAIHGHDGINHDAVYARLEKHLPEIIAKRGKAYFQVAAVPLEKVQAMRPTYVQGDGLKDGADKR